MKNPIKLTVTALLAGLVLSGASLTSTGCSSKPAFCSDRDQLEKSVNGLTEIDYGSDPQAALQDQLKQIEADASTTFQAAEQDFPTESRDVEKAVEGLGKSVESLPSSPDNKELLGVLRKIADVAAAFSRFREATKSACD